MVDHSRFSTELLYLLERAVPSAGQRTFVAFKYCDDEFVPLPPGYDKDRDLLVIVQRFSQTRPKCE